MLYTKPLARLIEELEKLPGIGPKSSQRLAFHLIKQPTQAVENLANALVDAKAQVRQVAQDLGLGRARTLSPEGYDLAAERWYDGIGGPQAPVAQSAPHHCHSCGFLVRITGHLAGSFGVCANGDANDDGRVVSMDHGCGAHSEVRLSKKQESQPIPDHVIDTITDELDAL